MSPNKKILIVDDDALILHTLEDKILQSVNVEILTASSYKESIDIIRKHGEDIAAAIVDLKLRGTKDGSVLHLTNLNNIPSIVFTEADDPALKSTFLQKHVVEYVVKNTLETLEYTANLAIRIVKNFDIHILIVDDSTMSLNLLALSLEKMHFTIHKASDGLQALEILKQKTKFSLVITDYHMPHMDGLELTQEIRKQYKKDELAVIAVSALEDSESTSLFLKVGANDFIKKPYSYDELALRINLNLEMIDLFNLNKALATRDNITSVHNKRYFEDSAQAIFLKAQRDKRTLFMLSVSLDNFMQMREKNSEAVSHRILIESAKLMQKLIRKSDLIARQSKAEFSILFENITKKDAEILVQKFHTSFKKLHIKISREETFTPSLSVGAYYGETLTLNQMMTHTQQAMIVSQSSGKGKTTFFDYE